MAKKRKSQTPQARSERKAYAAGRRKPKEPTKEWKAHHKRITGQEWGGIGDTGSLCPLNTLAVTGKIKGSQRYIDAVVTAAHGYYDLCFRLIPGKVKTMKFERMGAGQDKASPKDKSDTDQLKSLIAKLGPYKTIVDFVVIEQNTPTAEWEINSFNYGVGLLIK